MKTIVLSVLSLTIGFSIGKLLPTKGEKSTEVVNNCKFDVSKVNTLKFSLSPGESFHVGDSVAVYVANEEYLVITHSLCYGNCKNNLNLKIK